MLTEFPYNSISVLVSVALVSALISGLLGVVLTLWVTRRREKRATRVETLRRFAGYRYDITGAEFMRTLNEVFVVFNSDAEVMGALRDFHAGIGQPSGQNDKLIRLYKEMCRASEIDYADFNDSFFFKPFSPG